MTQQCSRGRKENENEAQKQVRAQHRVSISQMQAWQNGHLQVKIVKQLSKLKTYTKSSEYFLGQCDTGTILW